MRAVPLSPMAATLDCRCTGARTELTRNPPSHQVHGEVAWGRAFAIGVPLGPGVYMIFDLRGVLYVGKTRALRRRFEEHYRESHNPALRLALKNSFGATRFTWIKVEIPDQATKDEAALLLDEVEQSLIASLRPLCNVLHNY